MKILVYDKNTKHDGFTHRGNGTLTLLSECVVLEELNGRYEVEISVSLQDPKIKYVVKWAIIYVNGQLFRIFNTVKNDVEDKLKVYARHIFYDINFGFIEDRKATAKTLAEALEIAKPEGFEYFKTHSDILDINTLYFVKDNGSNCVFEIMKRWDKGELVRDNFNYGVVASKGRDNGVTFTYKKLEGITVTEDTDDVVTRLYPTGKDGVSLVEKYIYIPNWNEEEYPPFHITREVKFEGAENEGDLRILAQKEAARLGLSNVNFTINVNDLISSSKYEGMTELLNVEVGDIITIKHDRFNVRVKVKCIKKTKDLLNKKVTLELGSPTGSFFDSIDNNNVSVTIPDLGNLRNELFYHFNGAEIVLKPKYSQLASIRVATSETSNLMCHVTLNPLIVTPGLLKIRVTINNEDIQFSPLVNTIEGHNLLSFSVPLIAVAGGQTQVVKMWGEFEGTGTIPMNGLHFSITGQNVNMGAIKIEPFTGANIVHKFDFTDLETVATIGTLKVNTLEYSKVINQLSLVAKHKFDNTFSVDEMLNLKTFTENTKVSVMTEEVVEETKLLSPGSYEETEVNTWWTGSWVTETHVNYSGGKAKHSSTLRSSVLFVTRGSGFKLYAPTGPARGGYDVHIDGVFVETIQQYSEEVILNNNYYTHTFKTPGVHEVKLIVTAKSELSTSQMTVFDKVEILSEEGGI